MKKNILALLLIFVMSAVFLISCNGGSQGDGTTTVGDTAEQQMQENTTSGESEETTVWSDFQ